MMKDLYNFIMEQISKLVFRNFESQNMLAMDWDHLIVLDACRFDVFQKVYKEFFIDGQLKNVISPGSSTMEVVRKIFNDDVKARLKEVIFINSNPVIDNTLGTSTLEDIFYRYVPVWRKYWDWKIGTVKPMDVYKVALKIFINYPNKRFMIWFLQPHYPYISKKYEYNNINYLGIKFMNKSLYIRYENSIKILIRLLKNIICKGYLAAGIPDELAELMRKDRQKAFEAYTMNLFLVFEYVKKLTKILPGQIVITSDHGEAFGEPLSKLLPIPIYGHPSRIRIQPLIEIPYLEIKNNTSKKENIQKALKECSRFIFKSGR